MQNHRLMPKAPVRAVRADTPLSECVRILRDKNIGALVIVSDNMYEDVVGMFTERDVVRHIELIQNGKFWDRPVRTVMTTTVRTIDIEHLDDAPKVMARYGIRHLPVVKEERGRKRLLGVISMRDIFRISMEAVDYNLEKVFHPIILGPPKHITKTIGVISADKTLAELVDKGADLTNHLVLKAVSIKDDLKKISEHLPSFDALLLDIDGMKTETWTKVLERSWGMKKKMIMVVFNPLLLSDKQKTELHDLAVQRKFHLLSKPLALGLFYEKFLKRV